MRISDWSSDVCSSDLYQAGLGDRGDDNNQGQARRRQGRQQQPAEQQGDPSENSDAKHLQPAPRQAEAGTVGEALRRRLAAAPAPSGQQARNGPLAARTRRQRHSHNRKRTVSGTSVSVPVDIGVCRINKKKQQTNKTQKK